MNVFQSVRGLHPRLSYQKRSYDKKFDCDMGQIIPIALHYGQVGSVVKLGNEVVVRANPLVAPILHEVNVYTYWFACPLRILFGETIKDDDGKAVEWRIHDHDFETFMTGGVDGKDESISLPLWEPTGAMVQNDNYVAAHVTENFVYATGTFASGTDYYHYVDGIWMKGVAGTDYTVGDAIPDNKWFVMSNSAPYENEVVPDNGKYSLWDYLEFPTNVIPIGAFPLDFKRRMYNFIFNEYFRDENVDDLLDITTNSAVMNCRWKKDYFTSALPWQQRGTQPALPVSVAIDVSGLGFVQYTDNDVVTGLGNSLGVTSGTVNYGADSSSVGSATLGIGGGNVASGRHPFYVDGSQFSANGLATTFDVSDLRLAFQVQKWLEANARSGYRWKEFLLAHFGVAPRDERLQRPEYIGGSKSPLIVSEVLQTSQTTQGEDASPQGNLAGHGLTADSSYIGTYHVKENCLIMGLMVIRPKATYQQGFLKEDLYRTKYDFFFPEFAHLSEQPVQTAEIMATDNSNLDGNGNPNIFGYQARYNELRSSRSVVCGGLRDKFDFWHLGRKFDSVPHLNSAFLKCVPDKRVFASQSEPGFIVDVGNIIDDYSPVPVDGAPGLIDHA